MLKTKIVVCEKCNNIPRIIIISENKAQIECEKCNSSETKDFSYFDRYRNENDKNNQFLNDMPNCNFNKNHETKSILYCFQCSKYLCEECKKTHDIIYQDKNHNSIKQKIEHNYYCKNDGHQEYILDSYCIKCKTYLCSKCLTNHNRHKIYTFEKENVKIDDIKMNLKKSKQIIEDEENNLNKFIENIQKKIENLKEEFEKYKSRNMEIISLFNLLIENYEQLRNIRNYNIDNNIIINNNFDLNKCNIDEDECFSSKYNRLLLFFSNQNHILPRKYNNYYLSKKIDGKTIKKCVKLNNRTFIILKYNDKSYYYLYLNNNKYELLNIRLDYVIKDIIPLSEYRFIRLVHPDKLKICSIGKEDELNTKFIKTYENVSFAINDMSNNNRFFMITNNDDCFELKYYVDENKIYSLMKENKRIFIKYIFEDINEIINTDKSISENDKEDLKNIFIYKSQNDESIYKLINADNKLTDLFFQKNKNMFNSIKNKILEIMKEYNEDKYIFNSSYIYKEIYEKCLTTTNKFYKEEIDKIKYILNFNSLCERIKEVYINNLFYNSNIKNVYNFDNKFIIFIVDKSFINIYSLEKKTIMPYLFTNEIKGLNKNFDINYINRQKYILFDNYSENIIYIMQLPDLLIYKKHFKYNSSAVAVDNFLLFDVIKENKQQLTLIDLSDFSEKYNFYMNIEKIPYKLVLWPSYNKIINLCDDNQLFILDHIEKDKINNFNDIAINNDIKKLDIVSNNLHVITSAIIDSFSSCYDRKYKPECLFLENSYYCSKTRENEFIVFKFEKEYFFKGFDIKIHEDYLDARPKNLKVSILDKKKRLTANCDYYFVNEDFDKNLIKHCYLNAKGMYLKFDFLDNLDDKYIILERINFYVEKDCYFQ